MQSTVEIIVKPVRGEVRSIELEPGVYRIGSDLDCDIVLLDCDLEPEQLGLRIEDDAISIKAFGIGDGPAQLFEPGKKAVEIEAGAEHEVGANTEIKFPSALLQFKLSSDMASEDELDDKTSANQPSLTAAGLSSSRSSRGRRRLIGLGGVSFICLGLGVAMVPVGIAMVPGAVWSGLRTVFEPQVVQFPAKAAAGNKLASRSSALEGEDLSQRDRYAVIPSAKPKTDQTALRQTVALILTNFGEDVSISKMDHHSLVISLPEQLEERGEEIASLLKMDIPALRDITFITIDPYETLKDGIVALWGGRNPYIKMKDGKIIYEGGDVVSGKKLVRIENRQLTIAHQGKLVEIKM